MTEDELPGTRPEKTKAHPRPELVVAGSLVEIGVEPRDAAVEHEPAFHAITDRRAEVVGEHQEGGAEGPDSPVENQAVHDRPHGVLADPVFDVPLAPGAGGHEAGVGDPG